MSGVQTAVIAAASGSAATAVVGSLLKWGARLPVFVRSHVLPDHGPIADGAGWLAARADSSIDQVRVLVCCAPDRSLRKPGGNPDLAVALVRTAFGRWTGDQPAHSSTQHGVRFDAPNGPAHGYAWAHAAGRVDLCCAIPTTITEAGQVAISVMSILEVLGAVHAAVRSPEYAAAFGHRRFHLSRRFDWTFTVSPTISTADKGVVSWQRLTFPGAVPSRAAGDQQAFAPPNGYAAKALRSWSMRRPPAELYNLALRDFLHANGYHNVEEPIQDSIAALTAG